MTENPGGAEIPEEVDLSKPGEVATVLLKNSEGQLEPVNVPKDIKAEDFQTVCNIAFWLQVMNRTTPKPIEIRNHPSYPAGLKPKKLQRIVQSAAYRRAAGIMGFELHAELPTLTDEQELAILVLTDPSIRGGLSQRLKVAGIGMATYRGWLSQPLFRETLDSIGNRLLKDHETDLMTTLTSAAADGDINALKYAFEVSGRHSPAQQAVLDVQLVLGKVVEIIAAEVKDEATLARIGTRLIAITPNAATNIAATNVAAGNTELAEIEAKNANSYHQIGTDQAGSV